MAANTLTAIRYLLELEDNVTPALAKVERLYGKTTKAIDRLNTKLEKSFQGTFDRLSRKLASFAKLASVSPFGFGTGGQSGRAGGSAAMGASIAAAVKRALGSLSIRLRASFPTKKDSRFDTSANLNRLYKSTPQPPDFVGAFRAAGAKRFARGGQVPRAPNGRYTKGTSGGWGGFNGNMPYQGPVPSSPAAVVPGSTMGPADRVPALLTPGETVLPAKPVAAWAALFGVAMKTVGGAVGATTGKLAGLVKAINPIPAVGKRATTTIAGIGAALKNIAASTTFIALHTALATIGDDFHNVRAAMNEVGDVVGVGQDTDSLNTNFYQMNRVLGLSRKSLFELRDELIQQSKVLPLSVRNLDEMSGAMEHMVNLGVGGKLAKDLTPAVYAFSLSTGVAADAAGDLAAVLSKQLGVSAINTGDTLAYIDKAAKAVGVTAGSVTDSVTEAFNANEIFFKSLSPSEANAAIRTLSKLTAAGESIAPGLGKGLADLLARGAAGDASAFPGLALTGIGDVGAARGALQNGDALFGSISNMDPMALRQLAEAAGLDAKAFAGLTFSADKLRESTAALGAVTVQTGQGMKQMGEFAAGNITTFKGIMQATRNLVTGNFPAVLQFFQDLNPLLLLSYVYLSIKVGPALWSAAGAMWGLVTAGRVWAAGMVRSLVLWAALTLATSTWAASLWACAAAVWAVLAPLLPLIAAVMALIAFQALLAYGLYKLVKNWDAVSDAVVGWGKTVVHWVKVAYDYFAGIGSTMADGLLTAFMYLPNLLSGAVTRFTAWIRDKMLAAFPDWALAALNYVGVISDADLTYARSMNAAPVLTAVNPVQTMSPINSPQADNGELVDALHETNKHLAAISDNTAEGAAPVVIDRGRALPAPNAFTNMLSAGGI